MNGDPSQPATAEKEPFTLRARAGSFVFAFRGLAALLLREHNAWIHMAAAAAACAAGWWLRISRIEWCLVVFAIGAVLSAEAFNTAIETLADAVAPRPDPLVGRAKDIAAARSSSIQRGRRDHRPARLRAATARTARFFLEMRRYV